MKKIKAAVSIILAVITFCYGLVVYKAQKNSFKILKLTKK
jgi:hypothetical protein